MAQPYKGDRQSVTSKIPREQAKQLDDIVRVTSESRSDLIARLLDEYIRNFDFTSHRTTQELPLRHAS
jgi:metal-responsive CopG/Arc/MetJ family transcriptional regulator